METTIHDLNHVSSALREEFVSKTKRNKFLRLNFMVNLMYYIEQVRLNVMYLARFVFVGVLAVQDVFFRFYYPFQEKKIYPPVTHFTVWLSFEEFNLACVILV